MTTESSAGLPARGEPPHDVEVLVLDADTQYLIELLDRIDRDTDELTVRTSKAVDETIARIEAGEADCLVCTYDAGDPNGLALLEYIREHTVDVPVVMLPARETTVIDSRNLVAEVNSVFMRDEAIEEDVLGPHLVNVVEQQHAAATAERRSQITDVMGRIARDVAGADEPGAVESVVCDRLSRTNTFDAGWIAAVDDETGEPSVRATTEADSATIPGFTEDGAEQLLLDSARNAVEFGRPQTIAREGATYGVFPVETEVADDRALAVCSDSKVAFREGEMELLGELGNTLSRTLDSIATRRALESRVDDLELIEDLIRELDAGVVVYDHNGFVERANGAFADRVGVAREALSGTAVWNLLPGREPATYDEFWDSLGPNESVVEVGELDGDRRQFVTTRIELDGEPYNATIVVEHAAEEPMEEELAQVLSYEFRHWLELAQEAVDEARQRRDPERLQLVDELVDRMQDTIETEVATAARSDDEPAMDPQPLGEVARLAWNHVLGKAGTHEVRGSNTVYAHRGLLLRLFEHLFRTLLSYAEEATAVDVGLTADGFYVEDDGAGVPHDERDYADGPDASGHTEGGTGILIAERAAARMGWSLEVTENDTGGSRFRVRGVRYADDEDRYADDEDRYADDEDRYADDEDRYADDGGRYAEDGDQ